MTTTLPSETGYDGPQAGGTIFDYTFGEAL